jgi:glycopeptide antibiotics resistance protein
VARYALLLYLLFLAWLLVLARVPGNAQVTFNWLPLGTTLRTVVELVAWHPVHPHLRAALLLQTVGNVGIFVPLGCLLRLSFPHLGLTSTLLLAAGLSLLFEVLQYSLHLGSFDMDDLIYNSLGGFLGDKIGRKVADKRNRITLRAFLAAVGGGGCLPLASYIFI